MEQERGQDFRYVYAAQGDSVWKVTMEELVKVCYKNHLIGTLHRQIGIERIPLSRYEKKLPVHLESRGSQSAVGGSKEPSPPNDSDHHVRRRPPLLDEMRDQLRALPHWYERCLPGRLPLFGIRY
jgi:hypothetical protein